MAFKILEEVAHADIALEIEAETLAGLFVESALAVQSVQFELQGISAIIQRQIKLEDEDVQELLYKFLCEIVYLKDSEVLALSGFDVDVRKEGGLWKLSACLSGETINPEEHTLRADIKAITRHMFRLWQEGKLWKATVVVDV